MAEVLYMNCSIVPTRLSSTGMQAVGQAGGFRCGADKALTELVDHLAGEPASSITTTHSTRSLREILKSS
jgi:hypothetical protein